MLSIQPEWFYILVPKLDMQNQITNSVSLLGEHCQCNMDGSTSPTCDIENDQCDCQPFVTGKKCDTCMDGYSALQMFCW